jgi:hypothetical protein
MHQGLDVGMQYGSRFDVTAAGFRQHPTLKLK